MRPVDPSPCGALYFPDFGYNARFTVPVFPDARKLFVRASGWIV